MTVRMLIKELNKYYGTTEVYLESENNPLIFVVKKMAADGIILQGSLGRDISDELNERIRIANSDDEHYQSKASLVYDLIEQGFSLEDITRAFARYEKRGDK